MVFVLRFLCGAVVKHIRVLFRIRDDNWNSNAPLNSWFGVTVNEQELLVELNLENNNLEGSFPEVVTLCSSLKRLNLRGNKLTGAFVHRAYIVSKLYVLQDRYRRV